MVFLTKHTQNCHTKAIAVPKEKGKNGKNESKNSDIAEYHPLQLPVECPQPPQYRYMVCHGVPHAPRFKHVWNYLWCFQNRYHRYGYRFLDYWHTMAHHVPVLRCCGHSTGKLQWVIFTISLFYSHFFPFFPFFWYCNGFGCGNFGYA